MTTASTQRSLYRQGANELRIQAVVLRSVGVASPLGPGQQHEHSQLRPGAQSFSVTEVSATTVAEYLHAPPTHAVEARGDVGRRA